MKFAELILESRAISDQIEDALIASDGEITPEIERKIIFQGLTEDELRRRVDDVAMAIERLEMLSAHYKELAQSYQKLSKGVETAIERMKVNMLSNMDRMYLTHLSGSIKTVQTRLNPPRVDILDESQIPDTYKETILTEKLMKDKIKEDLKKGVDIQGARLTSGKSLLIKSSLRLESTKEGGVK